MNHKVGDKVRIRKDLKAGTRLGGQYVNEEMVELRGTTSTITEVSETYYILDNLEWAWTDEMLGIGNRNKFNIDDKVRLAPRDYYPKLLPLELSIYSVHIYRDSCKYTLNEDVFPRKMYDEKDLVGEEK